MNLRILKKLSKRAAPYLPLLGDRRKQFRAMKGDSYHKLLLMDRACWDRGRSVHGDCIRQHEIKWPAADGNGWVWMAPPTHPLKGTMMVGAMVGYYEPEWDEECCYEVLRSEIRCRFTDWDVLNDDIDAVPQLTRDLSTPSQVFAAARELVAQRRGGGGHGSL